MSSLAPPAAALRHHTSARASGLRLQFLGTRGGLKKRSARHRWHSALLIEHGPSRLMLDCGEDWLGRLGGIEPSAIVLTHGHPDHARGLAEGAPCPVYATAETWALIDHYPISERNIIRIGRPVTIGRLGLRAFGIEHSVRAPAVGLRVSAGGLSFFYAPDVVSIRDRRRALDGLALYIGDGARVERPLVRWREDQRIGHTTIRAQLDWCRRAGIGHAIFTHCGSEIAESDARIIAARVRRLGRERGVAARIAYDGLKIRLQSEARMHIARS